jgi:hypothetical protein
MIVSFTTVFAVAAGLLLAAILGVAAALLIARAALARARLARTSAELSELRTSGLELALAEAVAQLRALAADQERTSALPARPSLREAVALSRHGASAEELVATCRIGQGEARLIQMLHGASRASADAPQGSEIH